MRIFYFNADITVQDAKVEVCKDFDPEMDPSKFTLYRIDALEEPSFPLRRLKAPLSKNNVDNGDILILKSNEELSSDEKFRLSINQTLTGFS